MKNNRLWRGAVLVLTLLPVAELLTAIALLPDTVAVHPTGTAAALNC